MRIIPETIFEWDHRFGNNVSFRHYSYLHVNEAPTLKVIDNRQGEIVLPVWEHSQWDDTALIGFRKHLIDAQGARVFTEISAERTHIGSFQIYLKINFRVIGKGGSAECALRKFREFMEIVGLEIKPSLYFPVPRVIQTTQVIKKGDAVPFGQHLAEKVVGVNPLA